MSVSQIKKDKVIAHYGALSLICGFVFGFLFSFSIAGAQIGEARLTISSLPRVPSPNEEVLVRIESFSTDLDRATVQWFVGGVLHNSGVGKKETRVSVGGLGEETRVSVSVRTVEGLLLSEEIIFRPSSVFLVWESNTYTPPFYKGKSLLTTDAAVTITALPWLTTSGVNFLNPQELVYTWSRNGRVLGSQSGFGKQTVTITGPSLFQEIDIKVEVVSFGGSLRAQNSLTLAPQEPEIVLYEKDSLRGVLWGVALGEEYVFSGDEATLRAEPYFFSKEDALNNTSFIWSLNGNPVSGAEEKEITLRRPEESGRSRIDVEIINNNRFLQTAKERLFVTFGQRARF